MSIFNFDWPKIRDAIEYPFEVVWDHIKPTISETFIPALKTFLELFARDEGKLIMSVALEEAPNLSRDGFAAVTSRIISRVIAESPKIAAQDLLVTMQQVQSALQVAKVSLNVTTPADQNLIASIAS